MAERYDRNLTDIFNIQSEIARTVTGAAVGRISDVEAMAALARPDEALGEYPLVMRGLRHMSNSARRMGWSADRRAPPRHALSPKSLD